MNADHFLALLKLELRRMTPQLLRAFIAIVATSILFAWIGQLPPEELALFPVAGALVACFLAPAAITRDKAENTLEFLQTLPTTPATIAAAKFTAGALAVAPFSLAGGVSVAWAIPGQFGLEPAQAGLVTFIGSWVAGSFAASALLTAAARFDGGVILGWVAFGLLAATLLAERFLAPLVPSDASDRLLWLLRQPWAPPVLLLAGLALLAGTGAFLFAVTTRAIADYRHRPDQLRL